MTGKEDERYKAKDEENNAESSIPVDHFGFEGDWIFVLNFFLFYRVFAYEKGVLISSAKMNKSQVCIWYQQMMNKIWVFIWLYLSVLKYL